MVSRQWITLSHLHSQRETFSHGRPWIILSWVSWWISGRPCFDTHARYLDRFLNGLLNFHVFMSLSVCVCVCVFPPLWVCVYVCVRERVLDRLRSVPWWVSWWPPESPCVCEQWSGPASSQKPAGPCKLETLEPGLGSATTYTHSHITDSVRMGTHEANERKHKTQQQADWLTLCGSTLSAIFRRFPLQRRHKEH